LVARDRLVHLCVFRVSGGSGTNELGGGFESSSSSGRSYQR